MGSSKGIGGNLATLKKLAALKHIDLASSRLIHGNTDHLKTLTKLVFINFASADRVSGDVAELPETLRFANLRDARFMTGKLVDTAGGDTKCNLRELNLHSSVGGPN